MTGERSAPLGDPVYEPYAQDLRPRENSAPGPRKSGAQAAFSARSELAGSLQTAARMGAIRSNKVLLVDGDLRTSHRLAELLAQDGYEVDVARDGADALTRLSLTPAPSALITELRLPVGDGATIARYARLRSPELRVVVLTRYVNAVIPATFGSPAPVVLSKPLEYQRLLDALNGRSVEEEVEYQPASLKI